MDRVHVVEFTLATLIAFACTFAPSGVVAQTAPPQQSVVPAPSPYDDYFMSLEHRQKIYDENRRRPGKAVLYTLLLPGAGNFYAEQYLIGGVAVVLLVFAGTFVGYGLANNQPRVVLIGGVTAGLAYGGGMATSLYGVSQYNMRLRQGLKVDRTDVREVWAPALVWRF